VASTAVEPPPAPVVQVGGSPIAPAQIATGGTLASLLEGVIVQVTNVDVTDVMPVPGPADKAPTNEFVVADVLRVDDLLYLVNPPPFPGLNYASLTGGLALRNGNSKIGPRDANALVIGPPRLIAVGPDAFTRAGYTGLPTIPAALRATLTRAALA